MLATSSHKPPRPGVTPEVFRQVMGCFPTGVAVMTAVTSDGQRAGVTANSFNTVSLEPPLILWSLSLKAPSLPVFRSAQHFAVNMLAADQHALAVQFARGADDKFEGVGLIDGHTGAPLIAQALAHVECRVAARYFGGDHEIMLGEVVALGRDEGEPLVFGGGRFRRLDPH